MVKEFTLKDKSETILTKEKEGEKKVSYKIEYKNDNGKDKMKVDNGVGTFKITGLKVKRIVEGKEGEGEDVTKDVEISYVKDGWFTHYAKIDKIGDQEPEKTCTIGFSGIGSFRPTFWISIVAGLMLVAGLIWWWFSSSKSEDKEEEGL